jgi:TRAP-type transport system periplasmic protein
MWSCLSVEVKTVGEAQCSGPQRAVLHHGNSWGQPGGRRRVDNGGAQVEAFATRPPRNEAAEGKTRRHRAQFTLPTSVVSGRRPCGGAAKREDGMILRTLTAAVLGAAVVATTVSAQEVKRYRFAYDQPKTTGYGVVGDVFADKLKELSKGTMLIDQYPGAQLGQEPQVLQMIKSGDVDFCISSSANAATVSPQSGVMSLHFLFRSEDHLRKAIADPAVAKSVRDMIEETVQGAHVIGLATLGLRSMYGRTEVHKIDDVKGKKVRVQATATEDTMFPAYGAQTVHMPFGSVYTSLQTGVVDFGENGINVYLVNKHYEVAPVLSITEHEANNSLVWISDKLWASLTPEQKQWVQAAADEVNRVQPTKAIELEHQSETKLTSIGVKVVRDVDKSGFVKVAAPYLDKLANDLGPHAAKIQKLIGAIQ